MANAVSAARKPLLAGFIVCWASKVPARMAKPQDNTKSRYQSRQTSDHRSGALSLFSSLGDRSRDRLARQRTLRVRSWRAQSAFQKGSKASARQHVTNYRDPLAQSDDDRVIGAR